MVSPYLTQPTRTLAEAEAKRSAPREIIRYLNPKSGSLISVRDDGTTHRQRLGEDDWRLYATLKPGADAVQWRANKIDFAMSLPEWAREVRELPTMDDVEAWMMDGICPTPTGHDVEPDGHGPDGVPSWLLILGLI